MKIQKTKLFALIVLLILILFNCEPSRCESKPDSINTQYQAKYVTGRTEEKSDPEMKDDKSERFKAIEWIIMQNIIRRYEKLEVEYPDDILD